MPVKKSDGSKNVIPVKTLNLPKFSFDDEEKYKKMERLAFHYLPKFDDPSCLTEMLQLLSGVIDEKTLAPIVKAAESQRERIKGLSDPRDQKDCIIRAWAMESLIIDHLLGEADPQLLIEKTESASSEELLKGWCVLDLLAFYFKPEYSKNIQIYRDYIYHAILERADGDGNNETIAPITQEGQSIYFDSKAFTTWNANHPLAEKYEFHGCIPLSEKEPVILLYEDGTKTVEYKLQTEEGEDFSGKYFMVEVWLHLVCNSQMAVMQMDGFISDTSEERKMNSNDIGYRMEGHYLACRGDAAKKLSTQKEGQDLVVKGLKYPGYTTPGYVRLIGICPQCKKSFAFHGCNCYLLQNDVAYSDDGMDCCQIEEQNIDKEHWSYTTDGKTFRYYNSFNCPHCGTPYIDYKKHPENKVFGVQGCVHLGRKCYSSGTEN